MLDTIPPRPLGLQTLMAGNLDIAFGLPEVVAQLLNQGVNLQMIYGPGACWSST